MIDGVCVHTANEGDVIDTVCGAGQQFADPGTALAGLSELEHGRGDWQA
jgi:hypothetical protein